MRPIVALTVGVGVTANLLKQSVERTGSNSSIESITQSPSLLQTFEASVSIYQSTEAFELEDQAYSGIESPTRLTVTLEAFEPEESTVGAEAKASINKAYSRCRPSQQAFESSGGYSWCQLQCRTSISSLLQSMLEPTVSVGSQRIVLARSPHLSPCRVIEFDSHHQIYSLYYVRSAAFESTISVTGYLYQDGSQH